MKKLVILLVVVVVSGKMFAQGSSFTISYPIAFPMGNLHDYISKTSFRGINIEFNKHQTSKLDIGLETGWNTFYEDVATKGYTQGTGTITGRQFRYTNIAPILAGVKYYKGEGHTGPYVGVGLGVMYVNRSTDFGLYRITTETWPFTIRPELGIVHQFHPGVSGFLGVKYYAAFKTGDLDSQSFLSINIGVVFHN